MIWLYRQIHSLWMMSRPLAFMVSSSRPWPSSNQKYFYACLEVAGGGDVLVGKAGGDAYLNGALYQNGASVDAQAAFQLSYSRRKAFLGLGYEALNWVGILAVAFFLFILPGWGLFSLLWPGWGGLTWPEKLGLSAGLSLALYPLLLLWTDVIGLHLGALYAWLPPLAGLGMILWRNRKRLNIRSFLRVRALKLSLVDIVFIGLTALIFFTRFWAIRSFDVPLWADSVQHTVMAQLMLDNGGLFKSWLPYAQYKSFTVQFGFSAFAALFAWLTGLGSVKATLIVAQILNGLAVLVLYPLAVRIAKGNRWAGIGAMLVAGLLMPRSPRMMSRTSRRPMGSRPDMGSSRKTSSGSFSERLGQPGPLEHPLGEAAQRHAGGSLEAHLREHFTAPFAALRGRHAEDPADVVEVLGHREVVVEVRVLGQVADAALPAPVAEGQAEHGRAARVGPEQSHQELQGRGLARAVGPEVAEDLAGLDAEAQVAERRAAASGRCGRRGRTCRDR